MSPLAKLGAIFLIVALLGCVAFAAAAVMEALHTIDEIQAQALNGELDGGLDVIDDAMDRDPDDFDDLAYFTPGEPT